MVNVDSLTYRPQGWENDGANPACTKDVDECAADHPPCSVNPPVPCRNTRGSFTCGACPHGYSGNGYYCTDIDECLINNGGCSTSPYVQCINTVVSAQKQREKERDVVARYATWNEVNARENATLTFLPLSGGNAPRNVEDTK
jgi:hypothetical protein